MDLETEDDMTSDTPPKEATRTEVRYAVEVKDLDGMWVEMPGFSSADKQLALDGRDAIQGKPLEVRVVEVTVTTTITERVIE